MAKFTALLKSKVKSKKFISVILSVILCLLCISFVGCSNENDKTEITVYLNSTSLLKNYAPFLQSKVPEAKLKFVVGRDSENFYSFKNQNNDLPDIITVGTVSPNDEFGLRESLMDLGKTETAMSIPETYLNSYRDAGNALKWLPVGGKLNGIIANKKLFEDNDIKLPTDYASFKAACAAFDALEGVRPFVSDYKYDYTCLHTLEGSALSVLMSYDGKLWRRNYERGNTNTLDETLWLEIFNKFAEFASDTKLTADEVTRGYGNTYGDFRAGKVAMIRATNDLLESHTSVNTQPIFLPYFGETENDNRYITTPTFHVALNANLEKQGNDKKKWLALKVLDAMFSAEGYAHMFAGETQYFVSYSGNYNSEIPDSLSNIEKYIESNYLFPLLSSENFLNAAKVSVQAYLKGEKTTAEACKAMKNALENRESNTPQKYSVDAEYSVEFTNGGSKAASAVVNTLKNIADAELLLAPSSICTGSIYKAQYTYDLLDECIQSSGNHLYVGELTGEKIYALVKAAVEGYDSVNDPFSEQTLPVASGMVLSVKKSGGKFTLQDVIVNGSPLSATAKYKIVIADLGDSVTKLIRYALGSDAASPFELHGTNSDYAHSLWADHVAGGGRIETPTDYIFIK